MGPDPRSRWWTLECSPTRVTKLRPPLSLPFCLFFCLTGPFTYILFPFKLLCTYLTAFSCPIFCLLVSFLYLPLPFKSPFQQFSFSLWSPLDLSARCGALRPKGHVYMALRGMKRLAPPV